MSVAVMLMLMLMLFVVDALLLEKGIVTYHVKSQRGGVR